MSAPSIPDTRKSWYFIKYADGPLNAAESFELREEKIPELTEGQILIQVDYLAAEPSMRGTMRSTESYRPPAPLNEIFWAFGTGTVVRSRFDALPVGTQVFGNIGLSDYALLDGPKVTGPKAGMATLRRVPQEPTKDGSLLDPRELFTAFGPPGLAAYVGLLHPRVGALGSWPGIDLKDEVVLVTGAAGATGNYVIQLAKSKGVRKVIGIASGRKRDAVLAAGADAFVAYDAPDFRAELFKATNREGTVLFENVGGQVFSTALLALRPHARVALCGMISQYDSLENNAAGNAAFGVILARRLTINGFICVDPEYDDLNAVGGLTDLLMNNKISSTYYEHQPGGIEHAVDAIQGMLKGENVGKTTIAIGAKALHAKV